MIKKRWKNIKVLTSAAAAAIIAATVVAPTTAFAQAQCSEDEGPSKTLATSTAKVLTVVYEQMTADPPLFQEALAGLNNLISQRGSSMKPYDKATTYELRGSVKASLDNYPGALADFQTALSTNALPNSRNNQLRYFIAQLQVQEQQYQSAIGGLNQWITNAKACGKPVDPNAYYLLAAAYTQLSPPNWRAAESPARDALAANKAQGEPRKSYYDLLNLVYSELNKNSERAPLLEEMVNNWPGTKAYWTQLSGAYSVQQKDRDAFAVLEVAYRAGLLSTESELLTLVQYYSFFDNPYRGAKMLEREMNAGNIKRKQSNLILLSQLWSQSREHKKSIPILREAAKGATKGDLYYRLGQVLLADEQYRASQTALESALNRAGMSRKNTGDAWLLLGTARFSQAGPEDTEIWANARKAFVNAQRYENVSARASSWVSYIDAVRTTYDRGIALEADQIRERCEQDQGRLEQQARIRELQNRPISPEEQAIDAEFLERCTGPLELGDDTNEPAAGGAGDSEEN